MSTDQTHVIVGASLAGAKAAATLREEGFEGRVVLIGAEDERPYERPPLSKEYLRGEAGRDKVYVHDEERATLGPGDYFGEIALIDEGARTATVKADTDMTTYAMTFWEFRPIVETDARVAWKLVQALAHRLREADARSVGH